MKQTIAISSICGIALIAGIGISVRQQNQGVQDDGNEQQFTIQSHTNSALENTTKRQKTTCPETIEESIPDQFTIRGFIPTGALFSHSELDEKTMTQSCYYMTPNTEQIIPGILEFSVETTVK